MPNVEFRIMPNGENGLPPPQFGRVGPSVFLCPHTAQRVQGWFADDGSENGGDTYEGVACLACNQLHMVNPRTGNVLGADEESN